MPHWLASAQRLVWGAGHEFLAALWNMVDADLFGIESQP
jgi:hypothetical protein